MNIALLGYGKEGKSVEKYFRKQNSEFEIFDHFEDKDISNFPLEKFDLVFRTPSVRPRPIRNWTSITRYFFDYCPCPIIGVTGTKGKGTTCSFIDSILKSLGKTSHLVGNIGIPALDVLNKIRSTDFVVYEMSSFQLWDLEKSPHVAVVLRIEPDHLDVHHDFDEYVMAKTNIVKFQNSEDYCIFYNNNQDSRRIAERSKAQKLSYPLPDSPLLSELLDYISIPGPHNRENAEAALLAVACALNLPLENFLRQFKTEIQNGLASFHGLPHHIEFVRELDGVKYYDDNYSASYPSLDVAIRTFADQNLVLIAGGKDRHLGAENLRNLQKAIFQSKNVRKAFLIGELAPRLVENISPEKYQICSTLKEAVTLSSEIAQQDNIQIVLMSPGAPSFDMFENFIDRGNQFQKFVRELK